MDKERREKDVDGIVIENEIGLFVFEDLRPRGIFVDKLRRSMIVRRLGLCCSDRF